MSERETDSPLVEPDCLTEIKSREILEAVVEKLDLTARWGMDGTLATDTLEQIVDAEPIRGTDLISIRVRHTEPVDCRDIALEMATTYGAYRHVIGSRKVEARLHELSLAVRDQEAKVEEIRKTIIKIVRGPGGRIQTQRSGGEAKEMFDTVMMTIEQEKAELEIRLQNLLRHKDIQLMDYVSTINLPDNSARTLFPEHLAAEAERKEMESNGLTADHPSVLEADERIARIRREFDETVVKIRDATEAQLDLVSHRLARIKEMYPADIVGVDELKTQAYVAAKQEFDVEQEVLQKLKIELSGEVGPRMPHESVLIHDDPVIPEVPVRRNLAMNLVMGGIAGILLSPLAALPLMWLLGRRK